jgi:phenylacetic acid degradation operon negative regulatory protein
VTSPGTSDTRPLTARSVLLSLLLGNTPPRAPVAQLVRTAELFGIAEGTARTALSRMARSGEVTARDGWYELTSERLLARHDRQSASRRAHTGAWHDRRWLHAVVAIDGRRPATERARLRDALRAARLAELREGVWMRPDNLGPGTSSGARNVEHQLDWFTTEPLGDPADLAARLWDLDRWTADTHVLIERMHVLDEPLTRHDHRALADGFVTSAAVLRHFQADPLLPGPLLPDHWPGTELRTEYDRYDATYRACLATYFRRDW